VPLVPKKFLTTSPPHPSPKKIRSVYHFRGPKFFRTYQNFSKHRTNFPDITKFSAKLTQFLTKLTEYDYEPQVLIFYSCCSTVYHVSQPFKMEIKRLLQ
jgi:hypothetical protein